METKLWELSLFFSRQLLPYFQELQNELKSHFACEKNCISILIDENNLYVFLIALPWQLYEKNILLIKQKIAQIIISFYKPKTILSSTKNFDVSNHSNAILLNILSNFDAVFDENDILKNLSLCGKVFLDSYINFKLKSAKNRWKEIGNLVNANTLFLSNEKVKIELMQFLMTGIDSKTEIVKLSSKNNQLTVEGSRFVKLQKHFYSQTDYDNLLFALIGSKPKKIEIYGYKNFDVCFVQELSNLFGKNLILIE